MFRCLEYFLLLSSDLFLKKLFKSGVLRIISFENSLFMNGRWLLLMYFFLLGAWLFNVSIQTVINLLRPIALMFKQRNTKHIVVVVTVIPILPFLVETSQRTFSLQWQPFYENQINLEFWKLLGEFVKKRSMEEGVLGFL